jgi:tRNA-Thr(GGU) m(6)t(6)A37 methyltransferase TsaA
MTETYMVKPIGWVQKVAARVVVEVEEPYQAALLGLEQYSHVWVIFWFHENDNPTDRAILRVHPCLNPGNPLTGVFAARAPVRPNLIGLSVARLLGVEGRLLFLKGLDAREGTPVLDIKPYLPFSDAIKDARAPELLPHTEGDKV